MRSHRHRQTSGRQATGIGATSILHPAAPVQPAANHLMDTVLPVRPALIDRGSAARLKPGMLDGPRRLRHGPGHGALRPAGPGRRQQPGAPGRGGARRAPARTPPYAPEHVIYLGSALPGSDLDAGTRARPFRPAGAVRGPGRGIRGPRGRHPGGCAVGRLPRRRRTAEPHGHRAVHRGQRHRQLARHPHPLPALRHRPPQPEAGGWVRRCPADNSEHYPRTDPAIIVTVVGPDGRLLLGGGGPAGRPELLHARRLRRAGGVAGTGRGPRDRRGSGRPGHRLPVPRLPVLAVPGLADARVHRHHRRTPRPRPTASRSPGRAGSAGANCRTPCSAAKSSSPAGCPSPGP